VAANKDFKLIRIDIFLLRKIEKCLAILDRSLQVFFPEPDNCPDH